MEIERLVNLVKLSSTSLHTGLSWIKVNIQQAAHAVIKYFDSAPIFNFFLTTFNYFNAKLDAERREVVHRIVILRARLQRLNPLARSHQVHGHDLCINFVYIMRGI